MNDINPLPHITIRANLEQFKSWLTQYLWANKIVQQGLPVELLNLRGTLRIQFINPSSGLTWITVELLSADEIKLSLKAVKFTDNEKGEAIAINDNSEEIKTHLDDLFSAIQTRWLSTQAKHNSLEKSVVKENLIIRLHREDVYQHLIALCQNDDMFSILDYRKDMKEQGFERILISDYKLVNKQGTQNSAIGAVRLLSAGNKTTAMFVGKDAIWNKPISESSEFLFTQFIERVVDHFATLKLLELSDSISKTNLLVENAFPSEITSGLQRFRAEFGADSKTAFIIMSFNQTKPYKEILKWIEKTLKEHNIIALRADHKEYLDDLFPNIKVYMHACDFGVAIIDRVAEENINPNVSLEVGYMLGLGKNVLLLKDKTLKSLQTDLTGKLYKEFDTTDVKATLPEQINKWLHSKGYI